MRRVDLLIAAVLAASLVASAVGAFTYEDRRVGTFEVAWTTTETALDPLVATVAGAGEATVEADVPVANVSSVEFAVRVAGAAARVQPTAVRVEVTAPDGTVFEEEGTVPVGGPGAADVRVRAVLADIPTVRDWRAASPDAARSEIAASHARTNGTGTWTVVVRTSPTASPPVGAESYAVTVEALVTSYAADVRAAAPGGEQR